jgi:hypothetical protein
MKNLMGYGRNALKVNQRNIVLINFPFSDLSGAKRQFKSEVQQELMGEDKILRMVFDSQEIFWVDG